MKNYYNMNRIIAVPVMAVLLLITATATAQRNKRSASNAAVIQEFARLGKWNNHWPVQINLHITHHITPAVFANDSANTDMVLYYDTHAFYMQVEDMEQIANDSVLIMVNKAARMIRVFPDKGLRSYSQENKLTSFLPDTSVESLSKHFIATQQEEGHSDKRIVLQSRDHISGTDLEKEVIDVRFNAGNYQPLEYKQIKRSLVPVDSVTYSGLEKQLAWKGRLLTTNYKGDQLFFAVKEQATECDFTSIDYTRKTSPVNEHDRVVKTAGGEYLSAKGYEPYNVSQE